MALHRLPDNLVIVICDARKALFIQNTGSPIRPSLEVLEHLKSAEQDEGAKASDRAGRRFDGGASSARFRARSAMEQPDPLQRASAEFAAEIDRRLNERCRMDGIQNILFAAPPAFLGTLRDELSEEVAALIVAEIPKRLTDADLDEVAGALVKFDS